MAAWAGLDRPVLLPAAEVGLHRRGADAEALGCAVSRFSSMAAKTSARSRASTGSTSFRLSSTSVSPEKPVPSRRTQNKGLSTPSGSDTGGDAPFPWRRRLAQVYTLVIQCMRTDASSDALISNC
jgi:hypothetical protein